MINIRTLESLTRDFGISVVKRDQDCFEKETGDRSYDITGYDYWRFNEIAEAYLTKDSYLIQSTHRGILLTLMYSY